MASDTSETRGNERACAYRVLRYAPNLVRDEWVNIGVLVFDPASGERRLRLIEEPEEYARVRRLHPRADESLLRALRNDLEDRFATASELFGGNVEAHAGGNGRADWLRLLGKWDDTLSNTLQLAPQKGVYTQRPGRGNRAAVRRPRGAGTRGRARGGAGESRADPLLLRAGAAAGAAVGAAAEGRARGRVHLSGRSHAHRLRLPEKRNTGVYRRR